MSPWHVTLLRRVKSDLIEFEGRWPESLIVRCETCARCIWSVLAARTKPEIPDGSYTGLRDAPSDSLPGRAMPLGMTRSAQGRRKANGVEAAHDPDSSI
ncbi:MAG: hypothetical protein OXC26_19070 [Albidovulum sp.]|nr:hypothetical protein [Albidovulum sp.]